MPPPSLESSLVPRLARDPSVSPPPRPDPARPSLCSHQAFLWLAAGLPRDLQPCPELPFSVSLLGVCDSLAAGTVTSRSFLSRVWCVGKVEAILDPGCVCVCGLSWKAKPFPLGVVPPPLHTCHKHRGASPVLWVSVGGRVAGRSRRAAALLVCLRRHARSA